MRKRNTAQNSTLLGELLLLVAIILSISMIVTSTTPMAPSLSAVAFASHEDDASDRSIFDIARGINNNNQAGVEEQGGLIGNLISQQQSPQAYARNVNADNKMIIVENCGDGKVIINDNDQIIQTNTQSFNQEANNQVEEEEEEEDEKEE
jgi:hypothetical protein